MPVRYLVKLNKSRPGPGIGKKAEGVRFLIKEGYPSPPSFVCTWAAYLKYLQNPGQALSDLRLDLSPVLEKRAAYAVRSSANVEDGPVRSFAGQFKSYLNVKGVDQVAEAVRKVWDSTRNPEVAAYLSNSDLEPGDLKMAVLIQKMVDPVLSGVSFSKNPMTGLDEVVVEAVEGSGEALVQDGVTPLRWVSRWGSWTETPEGEEDYQSLIQKVVSQTKAIAKQYDKPVDLEWVYDGHKLYWLQIRGITSLDLELYSNRISSEFFPGIIKPLIYSINVPLVNSAWIELLTELIGPNDIQPETLAKSVHYRVYFNMGTLGRIFETLGFPRESLELLLGLEGIGPEKPSFKPTLRTFSHLPRMLLFAVCALGFGGRVRAFLPAMKDQLDSLPRAHLETMSERDLLAVIEDLYDLNQKTAYFNILTPLLMHGYHSLFKNRLSRLGIDSENVDLSAGMPASENYDPNVHLERLHRSFLALDQKTQAVLKEQGAESWPPGREAAAFKAKWEDFLDRFGHLSDSGNDFSSVPWRENPELVLQMIIDYAPPQGSAASKIPYADLSLPWLQRPFLDWLYRRAGRFLFYRDAVSSLYTYGYGLFRTYFLALGNHFVERGVLETGQDIFYLTYGEVKEVIKGSSSREVTSLIEDRKAEIEESGAVTLPQTIFGDEIPPLEPNPSGTLRGTPTSRGQYRGPVKEIRGLQDFHKLQEGDVLLIPYSDVGWTPLFSKAGAVIAESGGVLSHSSIVAREYGIPAVVSLDHTSQLQDGMIVTVDGYRGEVIIHQEEPSPRTQVGT